MMMSLVRNNSKKLLLLILIFFLAGCGEDNYTPKPKGYFRIDLPEKQYQKYVSDVCPFSFEYPVYATIVMDTLFFGEKPENPCWMNIRFKNLGGTIYLSYKVINEDNTLGSLIEDAYKLTFKHTVKAEYIDESTISTPNNVSGIFYEVGGNAASNVQFYLTDSLNHFLRGALYFRSTPNEDSLAPVINFVKDDMLHLVDTFEWENDNNL